MRRADPLGSRINYAVIHPVAPHGDVGEVEITDVDRHPYLRCYRCSRSLAWGVTLQGALILGCGICQRILDERRVA